MKKKVLVLIVGLLLVGVNGFAADGDLIVNGSVGIGTGAADPVSRIEVRGSGNTRITESVVNGTGGQKSSLLLRGTFTGYPPDTSQRNFSLITGGSDGTWEGSYINFGVAGTDCYTEGFTDPCTRMTIKQGNVGIGTASPLSRLALTAFAQSNSGGFTVRYGDVDLILTEDGGTNGGKIQVMSGGTSGAIGTTPYRLLLQPQGGTIGIGTINPYWLLSMEASGGGYYNQSTHGWVNGSSGRWKSDVKSIANPLRSP
jgi:hypothetical protein